MSAGEREQGRLVAENAAAKAATETLVASGKLSVGMVVERRARGRSEWREGYITSVDPLKVTCTNSLAAESFEWDGVRPVAAARQAEMQWFEAQRAERERVAAENAAARAATEKLVATGKLSVGMVVERRDGGNEWREGHITSLAPLKVTCSNSSSESGLTWDGVRPVSVAGESELKLKLEPAAERLPEPEPEPELWLESEVVDDKGAVQTNDSTERVDCRSPVRRELAELRALCARAMGPEEPGSSRTPAEQRNSRYLSLEQSRGRAANATPNHIGNVIQTDEEHMKIQRHERAQGSPALARSPRSPHLEQLCSVLQISTSPGGHTDSLAASPDQVQPSSAEHEKHSTEGPQRTAQRDAAWQRPQQRPQQWQQTEKQSGGPVALSERSELAEPADLAHLRETEQHVLALEAQLQIAQMEMLRRQSVVEQMNAATRLHATSPLQKATPKSQVLTDQAALSSGSNRQIPEAVPPAATSTRLPMTSQSIEDSDSDNVGDTDDAATEQHSVFARENGKSGELLGLLCLVADRLRVAGDWKRAHEKYSQLLKLIEMKSTVLPKDQHAELCGLCALCAEKAADSQKALSLSGQGGAGSVDEPLRQSQPHLGAEAEAEPEAEPARGAASNGRGTRPDAAVSPATSSSDDDEGEDPVEFLRARALRNVA